MTFRVGDRVRIGRVYRTLHRKLSDIPGGWALDRPVGHFRYWNQCEMTWVSRPRRRW